MFLEKLSDRLKEDCVRIVNKHPEKEEYSRNQLNEYLKKISKKEYKLYRHELDAIPLSELKEDEDTARYQSAYALYSCMAGKAL